MAAIEVGEQNDSENFTDGFVRIPNRRSIANGEKDIFVIGASLDAGLIAAAQRVEHYEIAGYGTARTYAEMLGDDQGASLLQETLNEEKQTNEKLTHLAKSSINLSAAR
jgi:ferritin-like metal-binding protein YciE